MPTRMMSVRLITWRYKAIVRLMRNLDDALVEISSIRRQMARSTEFRGYGPATLAMTGVLAMAAAGAQAIWIADPAHHVMAYLGLWLSTAVVSAAMIGAQMHTRAHRLHSGLADDMIHLAVEQFLPAAGAGLLLTIVMTLYVPTAVWMLPGLWQVIYSLGVFSSCRFLPRATALAGCWYLTTGLVSLALGGERALSGWTMGAAYGLGQLLVAGVLWSAAKETTDEG